MSFIEKVVVVDGTRRAIDPALSAELAGLGLSSITTPLEASEEVLSLVPSPSLILLQLPGNTGAHECKPYLELAHRLKMKPRLSHVPIIVVSPGHCVEAASLFMSCNLPVAPDTVAIFGDDGVRALIPLSRLVEMLAEEPEPDFM